MTEALALPELPKYKQEKGNFLRGFQKAIEPIIPTLVQAATKVGLLKNTPIEKEFNQEQSISADSVSLSNLALSIRGGVEMLNQGKVRGRFTTVKSWLLDAADGPVARYNQTASPLGAIKDVYCDRLGELTLIKMIQNKRDELTVKDATNELGDVDKAIFLSTVSKGLCEILDIQTGELGGGGMIPRRFSIQKSFEAIGSIFKRKQKKVDRIDHELTKIHSGSTEAARIRFDRIKEKLATPQPETVTRIALSLSELGREKEAKFSKDYVECAIGYDLFSRDYDAATEFIEEGPQEFSRYLLAAEQLINYEYEQGNITWDMNLQNLEPNSSAAVEAVKIIALLRYMPNSEELIEYVNEFVGFEMFRKNMGSYDNIPYVKENMEKLQPFIEQANSIAKTELEQLN